MRLPIGLVGIAALCLVAAPVAACVGTPDPVDVVFGKDTLSIDVGKNFAQSLTHGYRVTSVDSKLLTGEGGREVIAVVVKERTSERKTYVFVVPPSTRKIGDCNQPYLKQ